MLLSANAMRLGGGPLRSFSGVTSIAGGYRREHHEQTGALFNFFAGQHRVTNVTDRSSKPAGARHPVAFRPARKSGGLASRNECLISVTPAAANLAAGRNISGETNITFSVPDAQLQLVVSASGSASFSLTTSANLAGALFASGNTSVTFTVPAALLGAVADLTGTATITVSPTGVLTAIGNLSGTTADTGALTAPNVANAVWQYLVETGFTAEQMLRIVAAVTAGKSTGGPGSPVFRNLADTKDRVTGTADSDGNRSAATYDAT